MDMHTSSESGLHICRACKYTSTIECEIRYLDDHSRHASISDKRMPRSVPSDG